MNDDTKPAEQAELPPQTGTASQSISQIDAPYRAAGIGDVPIVAGIGVMLQTLPQLIDAAKLMARADICLPVHARNRPDICFALLMRTENWRLRDPFFVAENSYVVVQKGVERLAFTAAVFQAALLASGAIRGRPQYVYMGEGESRQCTVSVQLPNGTWEDHTTPPLKLCHPGHVTKDGNKYVKGSPLWDRAPDQQLGYFGLRNLVRLKFQDVLGGFYDRDEFDEHPNIDETPAGPSSPNLLERLPGRIEGEGFKPGATDDAEAQAAVERAQRIKEARTAGLGKARAAKVAIGKAHRAPVGRRMVRPAKEGAGMGAKGVNASGQAPTRHEGAALSGEKEGKP